MMEIGIRKGQDLGEEFSALDVYFKEWPRKGALVNGEPIRKLDGVAKLFGIGKIVAPIQTEKRFFQSGKVNLIPRFVTLKNNCLNIFSV